MTEEQIEKFLVEIRNISHGGMSGPMGLEALVMSLAGEGKPGSRSVVDGLFSISESIKDLAEAIRETKNQS